MCEKCPFRMNKALFFSIQNCRYRMGESEKGGEGVGKRG